MAGTVITFCPITVGSGAKYSAVTLAAALHDYKPNLKIGLIDLDFKNPYLAAYLTMEDNFHCLDLLIEKVDCGEKAGYLTNELFLDSLVPVGKMFKVLKGTKLIGRDHLITREHVKKAIDMMRQNFDYVFVCVSPKNDNAGTAYGLYEADKIIAVMRANFAANANFDRVMEMIHSYKRTPEDVMLLYNMRNPDDPDLSKKVSEWKLHPIGEFIYDPATIDNKNLMPGTLSTIVKGGSKAYTERTRPIVREILGETYLQAKISATNPGPATQQTAQPMMQQTAQPTTGRRRGL